MLKLANTIFEKMFLADKWNVGIINQSMDDLIKKKRLNKIVWLKEDNVDYSADPFITEINNEVKIYYEELNFWHGKGKIMMIDGLDFKTKKEVSGIIPSNIHLSYPYLFKHESEIFCIPETSQAKEVVLYKVNVSKPNMLIKHKVLLTGKEYVDTSIFYYNHKYWLFTNVSGVNNQLYIYYASTIDGDFQPHTMNPIPVDKNECRGAGSLFIVNNTIYRPTQNPKNCYGGSIQINKILNLSESNYESETAFEILPDKKYSRGIHNISFTENKIVVDGKRRVLEAIMPLKKLVKVIRK